MKLLRLFALVVVLVATCSGQASASTAFVSVHKAREMSREAVDGIMAPFTEDTPWVRVRCQRQSPTVVRCRVQAKGDRVEVRFRTRVRDYADYDELKAYDLRVVQ